jgi:peptidoglycan/LPS O-acetylase OafA/YrhL
MEFRHNANALRALAVMSVIFYHFDVPGLAG